MSKDWARLAVSPVVESFAGALLIEEYQAGDIAVQICRRRRQPHLTLSVLSGSRVRLTAPYRVSERVIWAFLQDKIDWIHQQLAKMELRQSPSPLSKDQLLILGQNLPVHVRLTPRKKIFAAIQPEEASLFLPAPDYFTCKEQLAGAPVTRIPFSILPPQESYLRALKKAGTLFAEKYLTQRIETLAQQTGLQPQQLRFRSARARWGSCSSKGSISLNRRLIHLAPELIDYVIIHELCHLRWLNHSPQFWALVESFCPGSKALDRRLRQPPASFL